MHALRSLTLSSTSLVAALLGSVACGGPADHSALFANGGAASGPSSSGGASATGGSASATSAGNAGSSSNAGTGSGTAGSGGGAGGMPNGGGGAGGQVAIGGTSNAGAPDGGAPNGGVAGGGTGGEPVGGTAGMTGGGAPNGGTGGAPPGDCSTFGADAKFDADNQHCYLVVTAHATFASAKSHCTSLGAHLVTLSDQQENDFVWALDTNEHWIGATDGKDPKQTLPGTYAWVDGEPFDYTDWSPGQPNATAITCGTNNGGGTCYEHCAFQWSGGAVPGQWNDRYCAQTIDAICEWDG